MERSMVHELNGLASSQFLNNRSTFISTAYSRDIDLRKYPLYLTKIPDSKPAQLQKSRPLKQNRLRSSFPEHLNLKTF